MEESFRKKRARISLVRRLLELVFLGMKGFLFKDSQPYFRAKDIQNRLRVDHKESIPSSLFETQFFTGVFFIAAYVPVEYSIIEGRASSIGVEKDVPINNVLQLKT